MEQIFEPNAQFQFDKLVLTNPIFVNSGNYFIKYIMNDSPLYIQPPKCATKQGLIKGGKKLFCDLLFTNENESFIRWIEDLENYSQKYIFNNREKWFETDLEMHDIESSFTSPLKLYKSGKFYIVRTIIPTRLGKCTLRIFDEQEMDVPMESIQDGTVVMTIWEIQGIKCSTRNFQIDIEVKQMMVIPKSNLFDRCLISTPSRTENIHGTVSRGDSGQNASSILSPEQTSIVEDVGQGHSTSSLLDVEPPEEFEGSDTKSKETILLAEDPDADVRRTEASGDDVGKYTKNVAEDTVLGDVVEANESGDEDEDEDEEYDHDNEFTMDIDEMESVDNLPITTNNETSTGVEIVDFNPEDIQEPNDFQLKTRNDVYYEIYTNAKKKAEEARNLAISAFLEAKRIKDLYLIHEPLDIFDASTTLSEPIGI